MRGSFFCEAHKMIDNKQTFRYRNKTILFDLNTIKPKIGKIKNENLIIYDSFINQSDVLLLLVNYSNLNSDPFWVTSVQIQASKVDNYIDQLKAFQKDDKLLSKECNSSKQYTLPCDKKTRTVGLFLGCFNCGIIVSYREIFGHETLAQAASFFLSIIDDSQIWPKVKINFFLNFIR